MLSAGQTKVKARSALTSSYLFSLSDRDNSYPGPLERLTEQTLAAAQNRRDCDYLIDKCYPSRPLIISFNYFTQHEYDFFGRVRKLETRVGAPFNRIMLRDPQHAWYQRGVAGLGDSVDEVAAQLAHFIKAIGPSEVITVGQSMGAYAAVLFGMLLQVDRVLSFGSLPHLHSAQLESMGDVRWLPVFKLLEETPPKRCYDDLIALARSRERLPELHMVAGTNPDGSSGLPNLDALHTEQFAALPNVRTYLYPEARHEVSLWLVEQGLMDGLVGQILAPASPRAPI
ncbi:MAG: hypothetical protein V4754_19120 [Pseudomonadota bacterium]